MPHLHEVRDTDNHFVINPITRAIIISDGFDNTAATVEEYTDIIAQWEARFEALEIGGGEH